MEEARGRVLELWPPLLHRQSYRKRPEVARAIVQQREDEGHVPQAHYAFDNGGLTVALTGLIERVGKPWGRALECARHSQWPGRGQRVDAVAAGLRRDHPARFRRVRGRCRNGETTQGWVCPQGIRLTRSGRKRLVIVQAPDDLSDAPRVLRTDALHWESGRVLETWRDRWTSEIWHEFSKPVTGLEAAQGRKEAAVQRHFRLSGVAPSWGQRAPAAGADPERLAFAKGEPTFGQRGRAITRDVLHGLRQFVAQLLAQGRSCEAILAMLMPA